MVRNTDADDATDTEDTSADLKCTKCGATASYADASIADLRRTCGVDRAETRPNDRGSFGGEKHNWVEA